MFGFFDDQKNDEHNLQRLEQNFQCSGRVVDRNSIVFSVSCDAFCWWRKFVGNEIPTKTHNLMWKWKCWSKQNGTRAIFSFYVHSALSSLRLTLILNRLENQLIFTISTTTYHSAYNWRLVWKSFKQIFVWESISKSLKLFQQKINNQLVKPVWHFTLHLCPNSYAYGIHWQTWGKIGFAMMINRKRNHDLFSASSFFYKNTSIWKK